MTNDTFKPQEYLLNGRRAFSVWAVIENWAVNEEGGHSELLANNGIYRQMWENHISVRDSAQEGGAASA